VDLSFVATRSASGVSGVLATQGDACAMPFVDSFFDIVFARHMLYHVSDLPAALLEIKRILMSRGKFVSVVNLPQQAPRVAEMLIRHTERHGVAVPIQSQVDSQSLPSYLARSFRKVSAYEFSGKLVFRSPEPLIAFAQSLLAFYGIPLHSALRPRIISAIADEVGNWFESSDKPWEDKKGYTIFTAQ
jgi:SAM-dependent methyltransferase